MELIVIGAGPAYTDRRGAAASSYLVRAGEAALLLELGQGAFPNLASTLEPSELAAVVVSHLHPDHFIDLVPLRHYLRFEFDPPRRVRVMGPVGLGDRLDALHAQAGFAAASLDVGPLAALQRVGPFEVEARLVHHTEESYAFRVSIAGAAGAPSGPGLVYSGDCGRADDLVPLIRPGDTLLSEASFGAGPVPAGAEHLTAADAGRAATAGQAARLLLTHIQMGYSRADALAVGQAAFAGPIQIVTEGDRFEV
ncbi:MAG: MBL fold metallo-hydrolase [Candidatus Limnocylindrales bacterium]|jgi:ribonuclease BN (tRNA processing enzyme)